jgi:response regulator RpfG family c-di-GMP phosphodiesterase
MYYEETRRQAFPDSDVDCFIRKPIENRDLIRQVKEVLKLELNNSHLYFYLFVGSLFPLRLLFF